MKIRMVALAALFALSGCAAHSPFILKNTTDSVPLSQAKYPPYEDKVFVTEQQFPQGTQYDAISPIDVGRTWYGSSDSVLEMMADRARELGANAVIQVATWHQPSGFSWAAPHGSGQAIRIDLQTLAKLNLPGTWH